MHNELMRQEQGLTTTSRIGGTSDAKLKLAISYLAPRDSHQSYTHIINNVFVICFSSSSRFQRYVSTCIGTSTAALISLNRI